MAGTEKSATRAPRGSRVVSQAFFAALDAVPDAQQAVVARAAQVMIRDELKRRREAAAKTAANGSRAAPTRRAKPAAPGTRKAKAATPKRARRTRGATEAEPAG